MQHLTDCRHIPVAPRATSEERRNADLMDFGIAGMGCVNCANRIRNALLGVAGVVDVAIDLPAALARVWYRKALVGVREIADAVGSAGEDTHHRYLAVPIKKRFLNPNQGEGDEGP